MDSKRVDRIRQTLDKADKLETQGDDLRWKASKDIWEEVKAGTERQELAKRIGRKSEQVGHYFRVWDRFGTGRTASERPRFPDAIAEIRLGPRLEEAEQYREDYKRDTGKDMTLATAQNYLQRKPKPARTVTEKAEAVAEYMQNKEVRQRVIATEPDLPMTMIQEKHSIDKAAPPSPQRPSSKKQSDPIDSMEGVTLLIAGRDKLRDAFGHFVSIGELNDAQRSVVSDWLDEIDTYSQQIRQHLVTGGWDQAAAQMVEGEAK